MKNSTVGIIVGLSLLGFAGAASAGERVALTDTQMDGITAGSILHTAAASAIALANGPSAATLAVVDTQVGGGLSFAGSLSAAAGGGAQAQAQATALAVGDITDAIAQTTAQAGPGVSVAAAVSAALAASAN